MDVGVEGSKNASGMVFPDTIQQVSTQRTVGPTSPSECLLKLPVTNALATCDRVTKLHFSHVERV